MVKKIIFIAVCVGLFIAVHYSAIQSMDTTGTAGVSFDDVDSRYSWATEAIGELAGKGIITGMEPGKFEPGRPVTREQFAKMLTLAFGLEQNKDAAQSFVDVAAGKWSFPYVEAAKDILPRDPALPINEFGPSQECTREEIASAVVRALGLQEKDLQDADYLQNNCKDSGSISPHLKSDVAVAAEKGLLQGADGLLRPDAAVTRAEAAVFLHRGMQLKAGESLTSPAPKTQTPIVGDAQVTLEQAKKWAQGRDAHQRYIDIADIYWKYGAETGIRPEVLYAQAAKETNFGKFTGNVTPEHNNWAGIKTVEATGDTPDDHERFATPDDGVRAHFNHMAAYVGVQPVGQPHGRYEIVKSISWAGTVKYIEELSDKWAPEATYGEDLLANYLQPMMEIK